MKDNILLSVNNLTMYYSNKHTHTVVKAVDNVSFELPENCTLGIVGESGCGKTTLGKCILGLLNVTGGEVLYDDVDIAHLSPEDYRKYRKEIQVVFQNPHDALNPRMKIHKLLSEPFTLWNPKIEKEELHEKLVNLLKSVNLGPEILNNYPHQLSGGQLQRISIALAIANKPNLIVLDEPTTSLDVENSYELLDMFIRLKEELGNSYIFISHDLHAIKDICDIIVVMYLGRIVEMGTKEQIFENPRHPYTQALMGAMLSINKKTEEIVELEGEVPSPINLPSGCYFHSRCRYACEKCINSYPDAVKVDEKGYVCCWKYSSERDNN